MPTSQLWQSPHSVVWRRKANCSGLALATPVCFKPQDFPAAEWFSHARLSVEHIARIRHSCQQSSHFQVPATTISTAVVTIFFLTCGEAAAASCVDWVWRLIVELWIHHVAGRCGMRQRHSRRLLLSHQIGIRSIGDESEVCWNSEFANISPLVRVNVSDAYQSFIC